MCSPSSSMSVHKQWWKSLSIDGMTSCQWPQLWHTGFQRCFSLLLETIQDGSQKTTDTPFYILKCYWKRYWNRIFPHSYSVFWQLKDDYILSTYSFFFSLYAGSHRNQSLSILLIIKYFKDFLKIWLSLLCTAWVIFCAMIRQLF